MLCIRIQQGWAGHRVFYSCKLHRHQLDQEQGRPPSLTHALSSVLRQACRSPSPLTFLSPPAVRTVYNLSQSLQFGSEWFHLAGSWLPAFQVLEQLRRKRSLPHKQLPAALPPWEGNETDSWYRFVFPQKVFLSTPLPPWVSVSLIV